MNSKEFEKIVNEQFVNIGFDPKFVFYNSHSDNLHDALSEKLDICVVWGKFDFLKENKHWRIFRLSDSDYGSYVDEKGDTYSIKEKRSATLKEAVEHLIASSVNKIALDRKEFNKKIRTDKNWIGRLVKDR